MLRKFFIPLLVWIIYRLLSLTWRRTLIEPELFKTMLKEKKPFVLAHWHGDEIVLLGLIGRYRVATITSTSKDGEMMNTLVHLVGGKTSRGSSTRGAVQALKGLIRLIKSGRNASLAVDGPKGPLHVVKPGVFELSRMTNAPIFWSGACADKAWRFEKSWNKTYLPKPFARVFVEWHGPMPAITKDQDPRDPALLQGLADALHKAQESAAKKIAADHP